MTEGNCWGCGNMHPVDWLFFLGNGLYLELCLVPKLSVGSLDSLQAPLPLSGGGFGVLVFGTSGMGIIQHSAWITRSQDMFGLWCCAHTAENTSASPTSPTVFIPWTANPKLLVWRDSYCCPEGKLQLGICGMHHLLAVARGWAFSKFIVALIALFLIVSGVDMVGHILTLWCHEHFRKNRIVSDTSLMQACPCGFLLKLILLVPNSWQMILTSICIVFRKRYAP